jgi:CHAD domain-containing protein
MLGEVRDRDVLIDYLVTELATLEEAAAFGAVLELLDGERDEAREQLIGALDGPRYTALLAELERLPGLKQGANLERVAADEYRRLRKAARRLDVEATDEELHRLRIRAKRARYAAEAVGGRKRFVGRAKDLQDVLGEHQDAVVAEERIRDLLACVRGTGRTALAAGRLIERQRVRRSNARRAWPRAWKRLERAGDAAWR